MLAKSIKFVCVAMFYEFVLLQALNAKKVLKEIQLFSFNTF
jgi:hypothetical protein